MRLNSHRPRRPNGYQRLLWRAKGLYWRRRPLLQMGLVFLASMVITALAYEKIITLEWGDGLMLSSGKGHTSRDFRIIDGDTVALGSERIRVLNIDTPEMGERAHCSYEAQRALSARSHARQLFSGASEITVHRHYRRDAYGRTLARIRLDGEGFGELMVEAGYAVRYWGFKPDWC